MKKVAVLIAILSIIAVTNAAAAEDCTVTTATIMYLSPERFLACYRIYALSPQQGFMMMLSDVREGYAVSIKAGTKCKYGGKATDDISFVGINGQILICFTDHIQCKR